MPFESLPPPHVRRIAIVGGGISGLGAAHALCREHHVTLFEAAPRLGGHARTVLAGKSGDQPVDTGFIVFNRPNYPNLVELFETLDVPVVESDMSFGASIRGGAFEYGLANLGAVLAQPSNVADPRFWGMFRDVMRFNRNAERIAASGDLTIGEFLERLGTGDWFRDYYLLPLSGAIWSTPTQGILDFPARAMIEFFKNHALLGVTGQHQWWTVQGGSVQYVQRLEAALRQAGCDLRPATPVSAVRRIGGRVEVSTPGMEPELFDEVIFATHSDDTLALLADPTPDETALLGAVGYQTNDIVLHADSTLMPKRRRAWASWVYTEDSTKTSDRIDLTYWMNRLQPIPADDPLFVTLNSTRPIREDLIYDQVALRHPVYTRAAFNAQERLRERNGAAHTWFCGAWMRNGFHEDGLASALEVAQALMATAQARQAAE